MMDLYFVTSPNVTKVVIALEEMGLEFRFRPTDLSKGEHLDPANVAGAINGKLPVIHDDSPADGGDPVAERDVGPVLLLEGLHGQAADAERPLDDAVVQERGVEVALGAAGEIGRAHV